jgi:hypothetical protein
MYLKPILRLSFLLLLLSYSVPTVGQRRAQLSPKPASYGFVSPNTREGLKLDDAIRNLDSEEEETLIRDARSLTCVAQSPIATNKSVGSWSDGAEHSLLLRTRTDEKTVRYILATLGQKAQQKAFLYFSKRQGGLSVLYSLQPQRTTNFQSTAKVLDAAGVEFRTLVRTQRSLIVYVVDVTSQQRAKVMSAARKLRARVIAQRGSAEFIGDDSSREKASMIFDNEIRDYESKHSALITKCQKQ